MDLKLLNFLTDTNNDGFITEEEFILLPPGEVENEEYAEMDRKWQAERKAEFHDIMDNNKDGKVDLQELRQYLDPTNPLQVTNSTLFVQ